MNGPRAHSLPQTRKQDEIGNEKRACGHKRQSPGWSATLTLIALPRGELPVIRPGSMPNVEIASFKSTCQKLSGLSANSYWWEADFPAVACEY